MEDEVAKKKIDMEKRYNSAIAAVQQLGITNTISFIHSLIISNPFALKDLQE
jgi:hypothetical protein